MNICHCGFNIKARREAGWSEEVVQEEHRKHTPDCKMLPTKTLMCTHGQEGFCFKCAWGSRFYGLNNKFDF